MANAEVPDSQVLAVDPSGPSEILVIHTKSDGNYQKTPPAPETRDGNIIFQKISPEHYLKFLASRNKESTNLVNAGALDLKTLRESDEFERSHRECVLDSPWTEHRKSTGDIRQAHDVSTLWGCSLSPRAELALKPQRSSAPYHHGHLPSMVRVGNTKRPRCVEYHTFQSD